MKLRARLDSIALELLRVTQALTVAGIENDLPPASVAKIRESRNALTELGYKIVPPPRFNLNAVIKSSIRSNLSKQGDLNISGAVNVAYDWVVENWWKGQPACDHIRRMTKVKWPNESPVYEFVEAEINSYLGID